MEIQIVDNYQQMTIKAADIVAHQVNQKKDSVLGLATGSTPEGMYARLVEMYRDKMIDFASVVTFNLDEYTALSLKHPQSYHCYMGRHLFDHVNIRPENTHIPHGNNEQDISEVCREYDDKISSMGGIDLQILGIGVNGHIGFNEPGQFLQTRTHLVELAEETVEANSRFFSSPEEVPRRAITMGMASIMHAKKIMLLASGESKASAIQKSVSGRISTDIPASLLQLHRDIILIVDKQAASLL